MDEHAGHGTAPHEHHDHAGHPPGHGHTPGVHGMLVVGVGATYLSHLPMFTHPHHRFQALLEARFTDPADAGHDLQAIYVADRRETGERVYTIRPEPFVLPELVSSDPAKPPRREFRATLFRGHFEGEGAPLFEGRVEVTNVIHFRPFDPTATRPEHLAYLLFGRGDELFAAHLITAPPDFDQVLPVTVVGHTFGEEELRRGVRVTIRDRADTAVERLRADERVAAELVRGDAGAAHESITLELVGGRELYFEEGELRSPPDFDPTAAEKAAGFG